MTDPRNSEIEERLRSALNERASAIQPSPDGLTRIEEKLMRNLSTAKKWAIGALSAAAAILIAIAVIANTGDDDTEVIGDNSTSTTSTTSTSTTTEPTTTTTETTTSVAAPEVDPYGVAYPTPGAQTFNGPDEAAESYATEVLGFTRLIMGDFQAGDSRSGEIAVSDREGGPQTTIMLRQMEDDAWYVLGSATPNIVVDTPSAGNTVMSPFETTGSALAFEGNVDVVVLVQADLSEAGRGFVTGSGSPPAGPFSGEISFTAPAGDTPGILVYRTTSAEDGHVERATSFPVRLTSNSGS